MHWTKKFVASFDILLRIFGTPNTMSWWAQLVAAFGTPKAPAVPPPEVAAPNKTPPLQENSPEQSAVRIESAVLRSYLYFSQNSVLASNCHYHDYFF